MTDNFRLIGIVVGGVSIVGKIAVQALNRRHTVKVGTSARATILHSRVVDHRLVKGDRFIRVQLAIPRPDGTEIVAAATIGYSPTLPKPGWTIPVRYIERFGTTRVEVVGGSKPPTI